MIGQYYLVRGRNSIIKTSILQAVAKFYRKRTCNQLRFSVQLEILHESDTPEFVSTCITTRELVLVTANISDQFTQGG